MPVAVTFCSNQRLDRVDGGVKVGLARWNHSYDCPQESYFGCQQANLSDYRYISRRLVVGKNSTEFRFNRGASVHLASIEANYICVVSKERCEIVSISLVPAFQ